MSSFHFFLSRFPETFKRALYKKVSQLEKATYRQSYLASSVLMAECGGHFVQKGLEILRLQHCVLSI